MNDIIQSQGYSFLDTKEIEIENKRGGEGCSNKRVELEQRTGGEAQIIEFDKELYPNAAMQNITKCGTLFNINANSRKVKIALI